MAHLASQALHWTVNLAHVSKLPNHLFTQLRPANENITARRAPSFPTTVCPRQLALTVSKTGARLSLCCAFGVRAAPP